MTAPRRNDLPLWLVVPVGLLVLTLSLPVVLPVAAMLHARDERRRWRASRGARCRRCGAVLGEAAVMRADSYAAAQWVERHKRSVAWRVVREIWAICSRCGTGHGFDARRQRFTRVPPRHEAVVLTSDPAFDGERES